MLFWTFPEWRSGVAGHLILSDEDLTSVVQGNWKRLNTLQHYKVWHNQAAKLLVNVYSVNFVKNAIHVYQGYAILVLEGHCPAEYSFNPDKNSPAAF